MSRTRFKFKSSGKLVTARSVTNPSTISNPIGIKTPLEFGIGRPNEDYLKMHFNPADQIKDNLKNLLLTGFGERLGRAELGPNLKSLLYDLTSPGNVEAEAIKRITASINRYMPIINLKNISVGFIGLDEGRNINASLDKKLTNSIGLAAMTIRIDYDIPRIKSSNQAIEVVLSQAG